MEIIKTIDLWTEQHANHYECFNGAFVDGFEEGKIPFDEYKVVRNCNCKIETDNKNVNISNKHNAIIFYSNQKPVRLMVINGATDIDKCINIALSQTFNIQHSTLIHFYKQHSISSSSVNLEEQPIYNEAADTTQEIDVGSCDRWNLLYNMLKGSYTESETPYGNYESDQYEFIPNLFIKYELATDTEKFEIIHKCAFINTIKTRLVPIQENSPLTK